MKRCLFCIAIIMVMFGCDSEKKEYAALESNLSADTTGVDTVPKIIKTADMQFRVKDVQQTKQQLGASIKAQGGTVIEFAINSTIQNTEKVKYSLDSLKEITAYRKEGTLVAKIPSEKLDELTNTIANMAVFVDQQAMKMDDQSIVYLANQLKVKNRVEAIAQIKKVANKKSTNVESALDIKDDYIDKKIENMNIDNRVKFSTITLSFYQDNTVKTLIIANDNLYDYHPGFFQRLGLNIVDGWMYFKEVILMISKLWAMILLVLVVIFGTRYYVKNRKLKTMP